MQCGSGLLGFIHVFRFVSAFFFFKLAQFIGHSARIQYYRGAGVLAEPLVVIAAALGSLLSVALDPNLECLAPSPCGGSGF